MTWVAAGIASGAATMSAVQYVKAKQDAKKAADSRPKYDIPKGYLDNVNIAKQIQAAGLPDSVYNAWKEGIDRNLAYTNQNASDLKSGTIGLSGGVNQANQANAQLQGADAQAKMVGTQMLVGANKDMADQTAMSYQLNQLNPYYEGIAAKQARNGALFQNLTNAGMMAGSAIGGAKSGGAKAVTPTTVDASKYYGVNGTSPNNINTTQTFDPNSGGNPFSMVGAQGTYGGNPYGFGNSNAPTINNNHSYADLYWRDKSLGY